jgi:hypothetical protein
LHHALKLQDDLVDAEFVNQQRHLCRQFVANDASMFLLIQRKAPVRLS